MALAYFLCDGTSVTTATLEGRTLSNQACGSRPMVGEVTRGVVGECFFHSTERSSREGEPVCTDVKVTALLKDL